MLLCGTLPAAELRREVLLQTPLTVTAVSEVDAEHDADPTWPTEFTIEADLGDTKACFKTFGRGKDPAAKVADLKRFVEDGYLWLAKNCGGCNASRGHGWVVVQLVPKPALLGFVAGGDTGTAHFPRQDAWFTDVWDGLEINGLCSHAAAPRLKIWMRVEKGAFKADLKKTWQEGFNEFRRESAQLWELDPARPENSDTLKGRLLGHAALPKWCGKRRELKAALDLAKNKLNAEDLARLEQELKKVNPGALPDQKVSCE
jgi:hypothetical protein